jgi:hypothetical protein
VKLEDIATAKTSELILELAAGQERAVGCIREELALAKNTEPRFALIGVSPEKLSSLLGKRFDAITAEVDRRIPVPTYASTYEHELPHGMLVPPATDWISALPEADKQRAVLLLTQLCHGGEFAAWMQGAELPLAASREYEEACQLVAGWVS